MTTTPIKPNNNPKIFLEPLTAEQKDRAIAMLQEWCDVDEVEAQEQRETGEYLEKALDEERVRIGAEQVKRSH
jgi:hypothetical protein